MPDVFDLPEHTECEIIDKIESIADDMRFELKEALGRANTISRLCGKLRAMKETK